MQYRKFGKLDIQVSTLGFGCMRLPLNADGTINEAESIKQIRYAIDKGVNYIDTAYPYLGGKSELLVAKALKDGYREKVYLADKSPVWLVNSYEDFNNLLDEQLEKLETDHIDFYLMHALDKGKWEKIKEFGGFKFIEAALKSGKIKHIGFSFHDELDLFKEIIDSYDWDFCQIQYNYMDEYHQAGLEGLKYAADKGMAVVIMEPLLGGKLANVPPKEVQELWNEGTTKRTSAEWALSWILNQPEVTTLLSGMNTIEQINENIETVTKATVGFLTEREVQIVNSVKERYKELTKVNCTDCKYCMPCPLGVDIPKNFEIYNKAAMYNDWENSSKAYNNLVEKERANFCVECSKCEKLCPQALPIREHLKAVHKNIAKV